MNVREKERRGERVEKERGRRGRGRKKKTKKLILHAHKKTFSRQRVAVCVHFAAMSAARKLSFTAIATIGEVKWTRDMPARAAALREGITDGRWQRWSRARPMAAEKKRRSRCTENSPSFFSLFTLKQDPLHPASDLVNRGPRSCGWQSARWGFLWRKEEREKRESETEKTRRRKTEDEAALMKKTNTTKNQKPKTPPGTARTRRSSCSSSTTAPRSCTPYSCCLTSPRSRRGWSSTWGG